jgi:hypothetical protein
VVSEGWRVLEGGGVGGLRGLEGWSLRAEVCEVKRYWRWRGSDDPETEIVGLESARSRWHQAGTVGYWGVDGG